MLEPWTYRDRGNWLSKGRKASRDLNTGLGILWILEETIPGEIGSLCALIPALFLNKGICFNASFVNRHASFYRDAFCEVARLVDIASAQHGDVVGQKLQGNDHQYWEQAIGDFRYADDVFR